MPMPAPFAPIGGHVIIAVHSSKPLSASTETPRTGLRLSDGSFVPMFVLPADGACAEVSFSVERDLEFRVEMADENGFANRGGIAYSLLAVADQPPSCVIVDPQTLVEMTPKASLQLAGRVADDHGLLRVELIMERPSDGSITASPVLIQEPNIGPDGRVETLVSAVWDAAPAKLVPGETVYLVLGANDNCPPHVCPAEASDPGQRGRSTPLPIKIIAEAELEARTRDEIAAMEARLRQIVLEQVGLRDATGGLAAKDTDTGLTAAQLEAAATYASAEARLARALRELASQLGRAPYTAGA